MIRDINRYEDCCEFISGFQGDPLFSDPMLSTQERLDCNLIKAFTRPNRRILGVYDAQLAGLFVLLTLPEMFGISPVRRRFFSPVQYMSFP